MPENTASSGGGSVLRSPVLYAGALVVVTFVVFWPCLGLGFVDWDDPGNVLKNPQLAEFDIAWNWQSFFSIFTTTTGGNYNPLPIATFAVEKCFFAPDPASAPFVFHLDNLLLHIGTTLAVFSVSRKLGMLPLGAFIVALFFGVHPMRVESVAWVTERKDVLYGLFFFLSMSMYISYARGRGKSRLYYVLAVVLGLVSIFSKVQAVTLPLSMLAADYLLGRNWRSLRVLVVEKLPLWIMSAGMGLANVYFLGREKTLGGPVNASHYSFLGKLAIGAYSYSSYLLKLFVPAGLSHYHEYPLRVPTAAFIALAVVPLLIAVIMIYAWKKKWKQVVFGIAFFTFNVMFLLQIVPAGDAFLAERFTYVAYFGLFFMLVSVVSRWLARRPNAAWPVAITTALYVCALSVVTWGQVKVWEGSETLYGRYVENYPESFYGYKQLGVYYMVQATSGAKATEVREGLLRRSLRFFHESDVKDSLAGRPSATATATVFENLGVAYGVLGSHDSALHYFNREIEVMPRSKDGYSNRAFEYSNHKQYKEAIADYSLAIALDAANDELVYSRANCYFAEGNTALALRGYNDAIAINSKVPKYYIARAILYRRQNDAAAAQRDLERAKELGEDISAFEQ